MRTKNKAKVIAVAQNSAKAYVLMGEPNPANLPVLDIHGTNPYMHGYRSLQLLSADGKAGKSLTVKTCLDILCCLDAIREVAKLAPKPDGAVAVQPIARNAKPEVIPVSPPAAADNLEVLIASAVAKAMAGIVKSKGKRSK